MKYNELDRKTRNIIRDEVRRLHNGERLSYREIMQRILEKYGVKPP